MPSARGTCQLSRCEGLEAPLPPGDLRLFRRLGWGWGWGMHAVLSTPSPGLWPLHPELTLSTCSFFRGRSCSNMSCKDLSESRRQMADEGWCPGLGGLLWVPRAPWRKDRGPRAAPGGEASVCAGGHAPGRADGSLGAVPTLPLFPPGASLQGWDTAAGPSPELGPGQGWVRSPQLLPGPRAGV